MKVLIADDEPAVRMGLKSIIDWQGLGIEICGEAENGAECLEKILTLAPDLVLLDIRMPIMQGLDVAEQAKKQGFCGRIIIISGYSDFKYAQTAIRFGVNYYLLKPIDEEELESAVKSICKDILREKQNSAHAGRYIDKARDMLLADILEGKAAMDSLAPESAPQYGLGFSEDCFRVVAAESEGNEQESALATMFAFSHADKQQIETLTLHGRSIYVLKGSRVIRSQEEQVRDINHRFAQYHRLGYFAAQGRVVTSVAGLPQSYQDAVSLLERRFFYPNGICIAVKRDVDADKLSEDTVSDIDLGQYIQRMLSLIEACNTDKAAALIHGLGQRLCVMNVPPEDIKSLITTFLIQMKHGVLENYRQLRSSFESDTALIASVRSATRLYEIEDYLKIKTEGVVAAISNDSRDHVIDNLIHYINKNYDKSLRLENLAELFGYNKAYLGKVFKNNVGEYFNSYLDRVRIGNAKEMLRQEHFKVYEISERIGYNNIDYFYKKFRKYVGESPSEYRRRLGLTADSEEPQTVQAE